MLSWLEGMGATGNKLTDKRCCFRLLLKGLSSMSFKETANRGILSTVALFDNSFSVRRKLVWARCSAHRIHHDLCKTCAVGQCEYQVLVLFNYADS